jgi:UDP-N-acetylglucosamine diphosphorylase/glucosamine-1-phosphate N-acetyltransferase
MADPPDVVLFEDAQVAHLGPLILTRPVFDLVLGAGSLRDRLEWVSGQRVAAALVRPSAAVRLPARGLADARSAERRRAGGIGGGCEIFVNGALLVDREIWQRIMGLETGAGLINEAGALLAFRSDVDPEALASLAEGRLAPDAAGLATERVAQGRLLRHSWELPAWHEEMLQQDLQEWAEQASGEKGDVATAPGAGGASGAVMVRNDAARGIFVHGEQAFAAERSVIEGPCVLDSRSGPILIRDHSHIAPMSALEGPLLIDEGARVLGGRIAGSYIGPGCRVRGEIAASVFLGWVNKAHEGFVGHSYVGEWVNLGALTTTSDLKSNYGQVRMWESGSVRPTGLLKVGSILGDHTKTAIGTLLGAGSLIGVGVNLFGSEGFAPRWIPSFVWGTGASAAPYEWERFLKDVSAMLSRRGRSLEEDERRALRSAFETTAEERKQWMAQQGARG